ncbi:hypothetical protein [Dyadobacter sediminis]|uniref:Uncharacterized protein n=1 Tax=Dyadobacter sediminis TaxID=1493691 RepID=A0A5R9KJN7_9BACT|nr:hypothetical protein [Dyadobacter sediminis]TLU96448.1 hypothetical protein FEM55_04760 [Dyadobacter sediminis]GGB82304.1 hypothetical protein GCM10011325_07290 [Dyadobacter sediminis]
MIPVNGISKQPFENPSLNFYKLREEGLSMIRALSGKRWTDHNLHDPGITTLEVLCYALTDLGYRTELVKEIFESGKAISPEFTDRYFFHKTELFPSAPLTADDFERKVEESPEVLLAWFTKSAIIHNGHAARGAYEIAVMLRPHPELGELNTDGIQLSLDDGQTGMDIVFFTEENRRMEWSSIDKVLDCKWDRSKEDNLFVYEKYNFQILMMLEVVFAGQTEAEKSPVQVKARGSIYSGLSFGTLHYFDDYQTHIIAKLESTEFIQELNNLLLREKNKQQILLDIHRFILPFRNLCEDFISFRIVNSQEIKIDLEVILKNSTDDPDAAISDIFYQLDLFLFRIVKESKRNDSASRNNILYASNLIEEIITKVKEVEAAKIRNMNLYIDGVPTIPLGEEAVFENLELHPFTYFAPRFSKQKSSVRIIHFGEKAIDWNPSGEKPAFRPSMETVLPDWQKAETSPDPSVRNVTLLMKEIAEYVSIQKDFPENYKLGEGKRTGQIPDPQQAKIRQFKAYLFFFERLLIGHLGQLSDLSMLFNVRDQNPMLENEIEKARKAIPELDELGMLDADKLKELEADFGHSTSRQTKVVNHLLARFATTGSFVRLSGPEAYKETERLEKLRMLLHDVPLITRNRGTGLPLTADGTTIWEQDMLSGFQKRLYRLTGIDNPALNHRKLSGEKGNDLAGFYLVEHILLIGKKGANEAENRFNKSAALLFNYLAAFMQENLPADPYSFQLTVILPKWYPVWFDRKKFVENMIAEEVPAHILPYICWLDYKEIVEFEALYENWLADLLQIYLPDK